MGNQVGFWAENLMPAGHGMTPGAETVRLDLNIKLLEPLGRETVMFAESAGKEIQVKMLITRPVQYNQTLNCDLGNFSITRGRGTLTYQV